MSILLFLTFPVLVSAQALDPKIPKLSTRNIVFEEIQKLVPKYNVKVAVIGSSVRGQYMDPLLKSVVSVSDVDMTVIAQGNRKDLFLRWTGFHADLKRNLETRLMHMRPELMEEYGSKLADDYVKRIVNNINVYPPDDLVAGVETVDDYLDELNALFRDYGKTVPHHVNLGAGKFDAIIGDDSARAFRQVYEKTHGLVFEQHNGKVIAALHDLQVPLKFTGAGTTSISRQFLEKTYLYADDAAHAKDLAKNLRRLNNSLTKAKDMAGMSSAAIRNPELDDLVRKLDKIVDGLKSELGDVAALEQGSRTWAKDYADDIQRALTKAEVESLACKAIFETTDEAERVLLRNLVESSKWQKFKNRLGRYYRSTTKVTPMGVLVKGVNVLAVGAEYVKIRELFATRGIDAAMKELSLDVLGFLNLGFGLSKTAVEMAMAEAKTLGYGISVSRQGCEDFLAGIVYVAGAEKIQPGFELEELARIYVNADEAFEKVDYLAGQAAIRSDVEVNDAIAEAEAGRKTAILKKCGEPLMRQWQALRAQWLQTAGNSANVIRAFLEALNLTLKVTQEETGRAGERVLSISIGSLAEAEDLHRAFVTLNDQIKSLGGREQLGAIVVEQSFTWRVDGKIVQPLGSGAAGSMIATLLNARRDALLGDGVVTRLPVSAQGAHLIELTYKIEFQSKFSPDLNVIRNLDMFEGQFEKRAILEVDSLEAEIEIAGPDEILVGEKAGYALAGLVSGSRADTARWFIEKSGQRTDVGTGSVVEISQDTKGTIRIGVEVSATGANVTASGIRDVSVFDPARVRFRFKEAKTERPIETATIVLSSNFQGGRTYRVTKPSEIAAGINIIPGPYAFTVAAQGYETMVGNTVFGDGDILELAFEPAEKRADGTTDQPPALDANIVGLSLNTNVLSLEPNGSARLTASALVSKLPHFVPRNVSDEVAWQVVDATIATVTAGEVTAGNRFGETMITAILTPPDGSKPILAHARVVVRDPNAQPPNANFMITPAARSWRPGQRLTFTQAVEGSLDDLQFEWYLDGRDASGPEIFHAFAEEGKYAVVLFVRSKSSGLEQRFSRTIEITDRRLSEIAIRVAPPLPLTGPARVRFIAEGADVSENALFRWLVDGGPVSGNTKETPEIELDAGEHDVFVAVQDGEDTVTADRQVVIGEGVSDDGTNVARPDARWRNRFSASTPDAEGKVTISSEYWARDHWSDPAAFRTVKVEGPVQLATGEQADGINTGWLLYVPKGRNELRFEVLAFDHVPKRARIVYSGVVPLHGTTIDPASVSINLVASRAIDFEWRSAAGDYGLLRLYKTPQSGFVTGGLQELEFIKSTGTSSSGTGLPFGTKANLDGDNGSFNEIAVRDYAAGPLRKFVNVGHGMEWSPEQGRVYIHVTRESSWFFVKIRIKGASNFGFVDEKGHFHDTRGQDVGYTDYAMKLTKGVYMMPVVPHSDIERAIGDNIRFVAEYLIYAEGELIGPSLVSNWAKVVDGVGISLDGKRSPLEEVDLSKITLPKKEPAAPKVLPLTWGSATWYLRATPAKLELRGAGYGSWGEGWINVASDYAEKYSYVASGVGPAVTYKAKDGIWHIKLFDHATGRVLRSYSRREKMRIGHGGQFGAYVFVGENEDRFFAVDIYNDRMREYDPVTKEYID